MSSLKYSVFQIIHKFRVWTDAVFVDSIGYCVDRNAEAENTETFQLKPVVDRVGVAKRG